jgi:dihydrolipoamide dehydrogenase
VPPIAGLAGSGFWTSREALVAAERPASLVIIGGGVIGLEFASFFHSLGTEVQVVEATDKILGRMDGELSALLQAEYNRRGVVFHTGCRVVGVDGQRVTIEQGSERLSLTGDRLLLCVGRRAVTKGLGLETLGLKMSPTGIAVDAFMRTSAPEVYACGDVTGLSMLAHTAVSEAEAAVRHITGKSGGMSYKAIPSVVYTNPEVAGVGYTEEALHEAGIAYSVKKLPMSFSGRFVAENEGGSGLCKLLCASDGTLLGAHLLGNPASELIVTAGIAIERGMTAAELSAFTFPHPTAGEILKETAWL